jgi:SWI/SNF-related matrix-associated actin-dependent regulator of chromatin subfamily D
LQAVDEKRWINLDAKLAKLFGPMVQDGKMYFPNIPEMMNRFIEPAEPIVLNYVVRVDKTSANSPPQYYDLDLSLDHPIRQRMHNLVMSNAPNPSPQTPPLVQIAQLDDQLSVTIAQLKLNCEKARFLRGFSEQPTLVMKRWIEQQQRSLDSILANEQVDEERDSESEEEVLEELDDDEFVRTIAGLQTSLSRQRRQRKWSGAEINEAVGLFLAQPLESGGVVGQVR